jgi:hypothetical protein
MNLIFLLKWNLISTKSTHFFHYFIVDHWQCKARALEIFNIYTNNIINSVEAAKVMDQQPPKIN